MVFASFWVNLFSEKYPVVLTFQANLYWATLLSFLAIKIKTTALIVI